MSPVEHHVGTPNAAADDDFNMAASTSSEEKWKDVPDKYLLVIAHFLAGQTNDTADMERFNGPILKASIKSVYWLFLIQYAALALLGVILNIAIIVYIMYHRLYKDITHAFIINLALCHFVQCALVLPISLMVMILQNWIFGQFLCFFLPMLQDIPLHVAMISHILIAWDRMRWLNDPLKGRIPGFVCCCATWLTGMVIALPYPIYTIYVELADYMPQLAGIGLCVVNLMDDMQEYSRGLFLIMYCGPAILLSYLYIRTSQELRPPDGPFAVMMYEHRADVRMRQRNSSTTSAEPRAHAGGGVAGLANGHGASNRSYDLYNAELDVNREKLKQRNFGSMAATQVVCLCPLMILRFARLSLEETYENQKHFDFTYLMFVWIAFLPTVIFPCIYASQILPRNEQERLRGYFRLSSKRKAKSKRRSEDFREDSVEKDEQTNTTNIVGQTVVHSSIDQPKPQAKGTVSTLRPERSQGHGLSSTDRYGGAPFRQGQSGGKERGDRERDRDKDREKDRERDRDRDRERERIERQRNSLGGRGPGDAGAVNNLGKNMRGKKHDVKINIISDGAHGTSGTSGTGRKQQQQQPPSSSSNNSSSRIKTPGNTHVHPTNSLARQTHGHNRHKVAIECMSVSNNSVSNLNGSTFCNANSSSLLDDSGTSNYGDGEESSVVSSMMHPPQRWPQSAGIRHKDVSFSECSSSTFSSSTLDRDLEIIDLLERERSMDIQEMMHREQQGEKVRLSVSEGVGRQLPDIEKIYAQRSPKTKRDSGYGYDKTSLALVMPGSDPLSMSLSSSSQPTEYSLCSTLQDHHLQNQQQPQLQHQQHHLQLQTHKQQQQQQQQQQQRLDEDEVPQDFYDSYTPGGSNNLPPAMKVAMMQGTTAAQPTTPPTYQYQYSRRASRKTSSAGLHHVTGGGVSTRGAKRDSFNSLNGTDLIAGAFCELDPTQPLNKMTGLDGRMRRSSPRNNSFSSNSARSSIKSRDYGHSSTHSAHPELDFRENIFAEL